MIDGILFELKGLDPVLRRLRSLPSNLQQRGLKNAMRKGATVVRRVAISNMQQYDREQTPKQKIFRNITVQYSPRDSKRLDAVVMKVGVMGGAKQYGNTKENVRKRRVGKSYPTGGDKGNPGGDTWYWRFVEFGVPSRGIRAKKPMTNALEQNVDRAVGTIAQALDVEIGKFLASTGR